MDLNSLAPLPEHSSPRNSRPVIGTELPGDEPPGNRPKQLQQPRELSLGY
jgi:hypothetical protein